MIMVQSTQFLDSDLPFSTLGNGVIHWDAFKNSLNKSAAEAAKEIADRIDRELIKDLCYNGKNAAEVSQEFDHTTINRLNDQSMKDLVAMLHRLIRVGKE